MNDILSNFQEYLIQKNRNIAVNTFIAYKADVKEFLIFFSSKNKLVTDIKSKDFSDFFCILQKRKLSSSSGARKNASLKMFAQFLHENYNIIDYSEYLHLNFSSLPIICSSKQAFNAIQEYKKKGLNSFSELRNFVILHLLYISKVNISKLIQFKIDNVNCDLSEIITHKSKPIKMSSSFCRIIKEYIGKIPYKSNYLFPVELGTSIKPISKQAVWTILRSIFKNGKANLISELIETKFDLPTKALDLYKIKHPRP